MDTPTTDAPSPSCARRFAAPTDAAAHFRRGIELTTEIRERVIRARGWYLGQTTKLPRQMLSAIFDPATTPITPYFTATLQLLHQHPCSHFAKCEPVRIEFEAASEETLETLRRFAIDLSPFLAPSAARACKQSLMAFRFANSRFFRALRSGTAVIPEPFASVVDEGLGLFAANQFLSAIAEAFTSRELMLEDGKVLQKRRFISTEFRSLDSRLCSMQNDVSAMLDKIDLVPDIYKHTTVIFKQLERLFGMTLARNHASRSSELSQEQVARDFGVSRRTITNWEHRQTSDSPDNKSNKYGYYRSLRRNPDLRNAYYELVNCARRYEFERKKSIEAGKRFATFVRFQEEWLKHQR